MITHPIRSLSLRADYRGPFGTVRWLIDKFHDATRKYGNVMPSDSTCLLTWLFALRA